MTSSARPTNRSGPLPVRAARSPVRITDQRKRYSEAGMTMPLLWPPFRDVPTSKTIDDLKRLKEEIMPKVDAR
jgi:hypothetical protein